jgi:16S rRNA (guanine(1405)-N(7))-methyltransferase
MSKTPSGSPAPETGDLFQEIGEGLFERKYRGIDLPEATLRSLLDQELPHYRSRKDAVKAVRKKLHNIIAPYLGDPDYPAAAAALDAAFASGESSAVRAACADILNSHASTRERQPIVEEFYQRIFAFTGKPQTILDLACGLNPFAFPWMGLPNSVQYYAYDLHHPRIGLINHYFRLQGLAPLAEAGDILVHPPQIRADVAFFFKEAHRFEQRQHGCNRAFWQALNVRYVLVSLPTQSLTGRFELIERQRRLVYGTLRGLPWQVTELQFETELVFCIEKGYGTQEEPPRE